MATKADLQRIGMWLAALRRATSAGQDAVDPETLAEYTIWLAADFPLTVFSAESVKWMAEQSQYFPKWAILKAGLTDWREAHPDVPRLAYRPSNALAERIEELTDEGAWFRRERARQDEERQLWGDPVRVRAAVNKVLEHPNKQDSLGRIVAGQVRRYAPQNLCEVPPAWQS